MAKDYYKMTKALFGFRDKLDELSNKKNQKLVDYLENKEINLRDEELAYPDTTEISKSTGLLRHKATSLIQELYIEALEYLSYNSLTIKEAVQVLYVHSHMTKKVPFTKTIKRKLNKCLYGFRFNCQ